MINRLIIENYALIDHAEIDFKPGLTIITGETGAGKSIMLDALSLLTGERADSKVISDNKRKTIVEAHFEYKDERLSEYFSSKELDWNNGEIIIRRELSPGGRNRAFINDTPVTLSILSDVTPNLIDIHSQNSNSGILSPENQINIIDSFCENLVPLKDYQKDFSQYVALRLKIKKLKEKIEKDKENKELLLFQFEQLEKLKPKKGELIDLEKEYEILSDADNIREEINEALGLLDSDESSILNNLSHVVSNLANINPDLFKENSIFSRLENIKIELKDISESLSDQLDEIETDSNRLKKIENRINLLYDSIKRFKVKDENELVNLHQEIKMKLHNIESEINISEMEIESKKIASEIKKKADYLTANRKKGAKEFSELLQSRASRLGLQNLQFEARLIPGKLSSEGQEKIEFYCSFNKNSMMHPIWKVASGGEMARLMLTLKSIMAETMNLPTVIFDEIDTGVSGEIADKMGDMMKEMSEKMQVIAITHLPQVAAKGVSHYKIFKTDNENSTQSHIKLLGHRERIEEVASMLSGSEINSAALKAAEFLLKPEEKSINKNNG